ncbi:MAG: methyltransferase domain-containing protein [Hyphomicrobiales bacterium]|nr:methyltransferase domain-containing protein [Hyphomicrobiales bacterium]
MSWLESVRDPIDWACVYCGEAGSLQHHKSYRYKDYDYHLHRCGRCRSLIYDPSAMGPLFGRAPEYTQSRTGMKYYFEVGYSPRFTAQCAVAAIPDIGLDALKGYNFLDIGAGNGVGSFIAQDLFGLAVQAVEPSLTGEHGRELFGLDVERRYFEQFDDELLSRLKSKPCLVHLDAVIEHLRDPRTLLKNLTQSLDVRVLCGLVPDGDEIHLHEPFSTSLPFLAPSDHVHLPTAEGMAQLFRDLGFPHVRVEKDCKLLIVTGAKEPMPEPSAQRTDIVTAWLQERLAQHWSAPVAQGAMARMLIDAVGRNQPARVKALSERLLPKLDPAPLIRKLDGGASWDDIPFYCGDVSFWLAVDHLRNARFDDALAALDVPEAFAARISVDYPEFAMNPQLYKWEARLLKAEIFKLQGRLAEARELLISVLDALADPFSPPPEPIASRAQTALAGLTPEKAAA